MIVGIFAFMCLLVIHYYTCASGNHKFTREKDKVYCKKCKILISTVKRRGW